MAIKYITTYIYIFEKNTIGVMEPSLAWDITAVYHRIAALYIKVGKGARAASYG